MKHISLYLIALTMVQAAQAQTWNEVEKVTAPHRARVNYYGAAVDISGPYAISGAWQQSTDANGEDVQGDGLETHSISRSVGSIAKC